MPEVFSIGQSDAAYPAAVRTYLGDQVPACIFTLGNIELLRQQALALFCSIKCPGNLILKTYDLAKQLRDAGVPVISGFHSPMEKECLTILLRGEQPLIICPARGLAGMRLPAAWRDPLEQGRLLIVSPFVDKHRRTDAQLAEFRNRFVAALAAKVFIAYAAPGGNIERLGQEILSRGKVVSTLG